MSTTKSETLNQIAVDLRMAADVLERDGWTQGAFHSLDGCHCAAGALELAVGLRVNDEAHDERYIDAVRWLGNHVDVRPTSLAVFAWNDTPGRTADEVIAALRAAADKAANQ